MPDDHRIEALEKRIDELSKQIGIAEDTLAIRKLQHTYGYFMDKCLYDETVDLFSERVEIYFLGGIFKGKAGARRLYCGRLRDKFAGGKNGPRYGQLLEHLTLQDVIDVASDRRSAKARFRCLMQGGSHESVPGGGDGFGQFWEGGVYENDYIHEDGVWKIHVLNYNAFFNCSYEKGWAHTKPGYAVPAFSVTFPEDPLGPDELTQKRASFWPETDLVPFHYPHPVTGRPVK